MTAGFGLAGAPAGDIVTGWQPVSIVQFTTTSSR
jgi:hypothetical protein